MPGIAYRRAGQPIATRPAAMIRDLDAYRIGWELIDFDAHSYWGGRKAVIMQFSRGCPHQCTYCGQRGFWTRWRHRDPVKFAREIAWLHREHGGELINLADENPTTSPKAWRALLDELIALDLPIKIIGSTRADDIVRDKDILPLYRKAGAFAVSCWGSRAPARRRLKLCARAAPAARISRRSSCCAKTA